MAVLTDVHHMSAMTMEPATCTQEEESLKAGGKQVTISCFPPPVSPGEGVSSPAPDTDLCSQCRADVDQHKGLVTLLK